MDKISGIYEVTNTITDDLANENTEYTYFVNGECRAYNLIKKDYRLVNLGDYCCNAYRIS